MKSISSSTSFSDLCQAQFLPHDENYNCDNKTKAEGCAWDAAGSRSDMGEWKYEAQDFNPSVKLWYHLRDWTSIFLIEAGFHLKPTYVKGFN